MPSRSGGRSALLNGKDLFLGGVDQRSAPARFYYELLKQAEDERGGRAAMTVVQRQSARQWVALVVEMERIQAQTTALGKALPEGFGTLSDRADRHARRMGPVKAPAPKDIRTHLAMKARP